MSDSIPFLEEPTNTRESIMRATYLALREHGYTDLTIETIATEFPKSKSLLYHHYDSKDDLLLEFLTFMLEHLEEQLPLRQYDGPAAHLEAIVDQMFTYGGDEHREFSRAMVELRAEAAHNAEYQRHFTQSDQFFRKHVAHVLRSGIEQGVFQDVDPKETAALFHTVYVGLLTQLVTTDDDELLDTVHVAFEQYVKEQLSLDDT